MRSSMGWELPVFGLAIGGGVLVIVGLLLSISLLANYRTSIPEQRSLLVVDLVAWSAPPQQEEQAIQEMQKSLAEPKQKKPTPTKAPILPEATPPVRKVLKALKEKPLATDETVPIEKGSGEVAKSVEAMPAAQPPPQPIERVENTLPTPVPIFQLTQSPQFLHREMPVYPETMRARGLSGVVKLEALIDKEGRVRQVNILKSAGEHFDEAAKQAVLASRFYPAKVGNEPVAVLLRLPVEFGLF